MSDEVLRDFDEEREERYVRPSAIKIGGEVLRFRRGIRPEEFAEELIDWFGISDETPPADAIAACDKAVLCFLASEDDRNRWRRLRERNERAITARDMREVINFLVAEQTGVDPTSQQSSQSGDETTGASSTERSSSEAGVVEASVS